MDYDVIIHYGGAAGNVFTYANAGFEVRFGLNLPSDFGSSLIRPTGGTNAPSIAVGSTGTVDTKDFGLYGFAGISTRFTFRNIFLDGNTFTDSHSVDKEFLVNDFIIGASLKYKKVKLSYAQVLRTEEFKGQNSGHNFGSFSVSYTY